MKTTWKNVTGLLCLVFCCLLCLFEAKAGDPIWHANDHFKISQKDELVRISMEKLSYESFSVTLDEPEITNGFISFEVKSDKKFHLRVDGFTSDGKQIVLFDEDVAAGRFEKFYYNVSESPQLITDLIFFVNPGESLKGEVFFKGLKTSPFLEGGSKISLHPNPTSDVLHVQLPDEGFEKISIYDLQGRVIMERPVIDSSVNADLNGQKAGIYMIKAKGRNATLTQRFSVK